MSILLIRWNSDRRIDAIKAVRIVFGLGLKEAKTLIENEEGFLATHLQWIALRGTYINHGIHDTFFNDWLVEIYRRPKPPVDMTVEEPKPDYDMAFRDILERDRVADGPVFDEERDDSEIQDAFRVMTSSRNPKTVEEDG